MTYRRAVVWFRRDLRVEDQRVLSEASSLASEVLPVYIFIPSLLERFGRRGDRLGFIVSALRNLESRLCTLGGNLYVFIGEPKEVFTQIFRVAKPDAVFFNKAYSFSGKRYDEEVKNLCRTFGVSFHEYSDNFLCDPKAIPFRKVFSSFFRHWIKAVDLTQYQRPERINTPKLPFSTLSEVLSRLTYEANRYFPLDFGFTRLKTFDFRSYAELRNRLDMDGTSKLSPYIRFGVISLRTIFKEAEKQAGRQCQFIKELAWREFWYHLKEYFPEMADHEFQETKRNLPWRHDEKLFRAFIEARTGYPIVDAAIRQLLTEGYMHNRARMIVASFLTKDLLIDWRLGEAFFREHLLDYDEVVNTGNWQWVASVGADPKPLRIFNPILQAERFDPKAEYIKRYLPELSKLPASALKDPLKNKLPYHPPIVNHYESVKLAKKFYQGSL